MRESVIAEEGARRLVCVKDDAGNHIMMTLEQLGAYLDNVASDQVPMVALLHESWLAREDLVTWNENKGRLLADMGRRLGKRL